MSADSLPQPLRIATDTAINLAKLTAENWEDEYVKETFCTVALKMYALWTLHINLLPTDKH